MLLGACSAQRLVYDNADRLLLARIDRYVQLDDAQEALALDLLGKRLARHRRVELEPTADLLDRLARAIDQGFDAADADAIAAEFERRLIELLDESVPTLAAIGAQLRADQVEQLAARFERNAREYRQKYLGEDDPAQRLAAREGRFVGRLESWFGTLDERQRQLIVRHVRDMRETAALWAAYRDERQGELLALLRQQAPEVAVADSLREFLVRTDRAPPALRAARDTNRRVFVAAMLDLQPTLTDRQKRKLGDRLRRLASDARTLAARSGRSSAARSELRLAAAIAARQLPC